MLKSQNNYSVLGSLEDCKRYRVAGFSIPLRRGAPGQVLADFARKFHNTVERLNPTDCHGFNRRQISGSNEWSNHASGTAVDLNATRHPYGRENTFDSSELVNLNTLLADYDNVIRWGGDYRYTKDEMHFEIDASLNEVSLVAQRMRRKNTVSLKRLNVGKRNIDVYMVKRAMKQRGFFDGPLTKYFGRGFQNEYSKWQEYLGYTGAGADGIPGRASLEALGFEVED